MPDQPPIPQHEMVRVFHLKIYFGQLFEGQVPYVHERHVEVAAQFAQRACQPVLPPTHVVLIARIHEQHLRLVPKPRLHHMLHHTQRVPPHINVREHNRPFHLHYHAPVAQLRQYLCFCTSKASKLFTRRRCGGPAAAATCCAAALPPAPTRSAPAQRTPQTLSDP